MERVELDLDVDALGDDLAVQHEVLLQLTTYEGHDGVKTLGFFDAHGQVLELTEVFPVNDDNSQLDNDKIKFSPKLGRCRFDATDRVNSATKQNNTNYIFCGT